MNQFKKAKQNSHQTESITDLKTAGVAPTTEKPVISEQKDLIPEKDEPVNIATVEVPASEKTAFSDNIPTYQVENASHRTVIDNETSPIIQSQETVPQMVAAQQTTAPIIQPQHSEYTETYSEPVSEKTSKSGKKNAPNMFTQKSESKSIRKSLVLRPSSVRIAENYCAKNGGSFNELIQILLDNFIDEYGL